MNRIISVAIMFFLSLVAGNVWGNIQYTVTFLGDGEAKGINAIGQVVGTSSANHAFLYSNGTRTDLGTLGNLRSAAYDINDNEQIVGYYGNGTSSNYSHAFLYSNGTMTDLGLGGQSCG